MMQRLLLVIPALALCLLLPACGDDTSADAGGGSDNNHAHVHGPNGGEVGRIDGTDYWIEAYQIEDDATLVVWLHEGKVLDAVKPAMPDAPLTLSLVSDGSQMMIEGSKDDASGANAWKFEHPALGGHLDHATRIGVVVGGSAKRVSVPHHHH